MKSATSTGTSFVKTMAATASGFIVAEVAMRGFNEALSVGKEMLIGYNARMEQAEIGFTTLLGSQEQALSLIYDLKKFAAQTPFDFPGLQTSANTMLAMGFAAQDIIPTLTAVGDAMAAMGKSGAEGGQYVQRIVYDLGQMKQMGRVTNMELRQMAMLGVPVYKTLAKGFGVSEAAMMKMVRDGVVPVDKALKLLIQGIEDGNMGGMMAAQAKTFNGAMSNIKDGMSNLLGGALRPLFNAIRDAIVPFSLWISDLDKTQPIIDSLSVKVRALVIVMQDLAAEVMDFARGILSGVPAAVTAVRTLVDNVAKTIAGSASAMATGGYNTVVAYAQGMMAAAKSWVAAAVNWITQYVSNYLIGGSPPPMGPLSDIFKGGQNVIEAWVEGALAADLSPILAIPSQIAASFKTLESASSYVSNILGSLDDQLSLIDLNLGKLQRAAEALRQRYEDQLAPLQRQYDLLMATYTLADKKRDIELALKKNALQQQLLAAKGDWWAQEQIQKQIDVLDAQAEQNRLLEEQESLQAQLAAIPLEEQMQALTDQYEAALVPIQAQMDILTAQRDELDYQRKVWQEIADSVRTTADAMSQAAAAAKAAAGGVRAGGAGGKVGLEEGLPSGTPPPFPVNKSIIDAQKAGEVLAQNLANGIQKGFGDWVKANAFKLVGTLVGTIIGGLVGSGPGALIGGALGGMIGSGLDYLVTTPAFKQGFADLQDRVREFLAGIFGIGTGGLKFDFASLVNAIREWAEKAFDWLLNTGVPTLANISSQLWLAFISWVGDAIPWLLENLPKITDAIFLFIADEAPKLLAAVLQWTWALTDWVLTQAVPTLLAKLPAIVTALVSWITQLARTMVVRGAQLGAGFIAVIFQYIGSLPSRIGTLFGTVLGKIVAAIPGIIATVSKMGSNILTTFVTNIGGIPAALMRILGDMVSQVTQWIPSGAKSLGNVAKGIARGFANGISNMLEGAINSVIRAINSFKIPPIVIDLGPLGKQRFGGWGGFNLGYVNLPNFEKGAFRIPKDMLASLHRGEMVVPKAPAEKMRKLMDSGSTLGGRGLVVNGPLVNIETFRGSDSEVDDLMVKMTNALRLQGVG